MAVTLVNLAGRVKGSFLNVVFYPRLDSQIVRIKASSIKNPRTTAQQLNRMNMLPLITAYSKLKPFLYKSFNFRAENHNVFHAFSSLNLNFSFKNGVFYPDDLIISNPINETTILDPLQVYINDSNFYFSWSGTTTGNQSIYDLLYLIVYIPDSEKFYIINTEKSRQDLELYINLDFLTVSSSIYIYPTFVKSDYSDSFLNDCINFDYFHIPGYSTINNGYLYNHYTVNHSLFCPEGWHLPSVSEFNTLATYLGGLAAAGGKMKTTGTTLWNSPNTGATNSSNFCGFPSGYIDTSGAFGRLHKNLYMWTSDLPSGDNRYCKSLYYNETNLSQSTFSKKYGLSVRLIKNDSFDTGFLKDFDNNIYNSVKIGNQVWSRENYKCTTLSDGTSIPYINSVGGWQSLNTLGRCAYQHEVDYS